MTMLEGFEETESERTDEASPAIVSTELESPFIAGAQFTDESAVTGDRFDQAEDEQSLASPFVSAMVTATEAQDETEAFAELLEQLEDEEFDEAVVQLVDAAAARDLASQASWTSAAEAPQATEAELEEWVEPLARESERVFDEMGDHLADTSFETVSETELDRLLESLSFEPQLMPTEFEDFIKSIWNKAKKVVKGAARMVKKGIKVVGKILPIGALLKRIGRLVRPLLKKVLKKAIGKLPPRFRSIARQVAARFGKEAEFEDELEEESEEGFADNEEPEALTRDFDIQAAGLLLAESEAEEETINAEAVNEADEETEASNPLAELGVARAKLADELTRLQPGADPTAELEEFIPVAMAAAPLLRLGLRLIGRGRVVGFLAKRIAGLIKGLVGAQAAKQISRPIVNVGLKTMGLEVPVQAETQFAGEALAATVEESVRDVLELPSEAFEDELMLDAAVQQAFAEAAARNLPGQFLQPDLPERETEEEAGVWIFMPRASRPRFRFKKFTRVYTVPIRRHVAAAVPWSDGGTLETHLLDNGVQAWPVQAEVHLYEAIPGTEIGHFTHDEGVEGEEPEASEFQALTEAAASMLIGEPRLARGARAPQATGARRRPRPGRRYYRVRVRGQAVGRRRRPRRRVRVRFDLASGSPSIRLRLLLSEREIQEVARQLRSRRAAGVVSWFRNRFAGQLRVRLAVRVRARGAQLSRTTPSPQRVQAVSRRLTDASMLAISKFVRERSSQLVAAAQSPAQGATVTITFQASHPGGLLAASAPSVTVSPGWAQ
jgi:hypothetical protein